MGDIADMHHGISMMQKHEVHEKISKLLDAKTDQQLYQESEESTQELVIKIRQYYLQNNQLSEKQRYCLARAIICKQ